MCYLFGGSWDASTRCGSRCSNWNNVPLTLNANIGGRGFADTEESNVMTSMTKEKELTSGWVHWPSLMGKYKTEGDAGLVWKQKVLQAIYYEKTRKLIFRNY